MSPNRDSASLTRNLERLLPVQQPTVIVHSEHRKECSDLCPFLDLPAELRNTIYTLAPSHSNETFVEAALLVPKLALLQTRSQIRNEASGIFYSSNAFRITPSPRNLAFFTKWLIRLALTRDLSGS